MPYQGNLPLSRPPQAKNQTLHERTRDKLCMHMTFHRHVQYPTHYATQHHTLTRPSWLQQLRPLGKFLCEVKKRFEPLFINSCFHKCYANRAQFHQEFALVRLS